MSYRFVCKQPDLSKDKNEYQNFSGKIFDLRKNTINKVNSTLMFKNISYPLEENFAKNLEFLLNRLKKLGISRLDCHDTAYILNTGNNRNNSGPFTDNELESIGFKYIGVKKIDLIFDNLEYSWISRIMPNKEKMIQDGKFRIIYELSENTKDGKYNFEQGDILTYGNSIYSGHSMVYLGKNGNEDSFISKIGNGKLAIHSFVDACLYYKFNEAYILKKIK